MNGSLPALTPAIHTDRRAEIRHYERSILDIVNDLERLVSEMADDIEPLPDGLVRDSLHLARNHVARSRSQAQIARVYLTGALEAHNTTRDGIYS